MNQNNGQYRQLQKTASTPRLVQPIRQEVYENEPKKK